MSTCFPSIPFSSWCLHPWVEPDDDCSRIAQQGVVVRADVHNGPDGRSKGSGIVAFDNPEDARNAITQFNGYEWQGRPLEVREDRFAGFGPGFGGSPRAGYGGRGAFGARGSYGGRGGGGGYGRAGYGGYGGGGGGGSGNYGSTGPVSPNSFTDNAASGGEPSETIHVRNVSSSTPAGLGACVLAKGAAAVVVVLSKSARPLAKTDAVRPQSSSHGPPAMKISWSFSRRSGRSNGLRSSTNPTDVLRVPALSSLTRPRMLTQPSVSSALPPAPIFIAHLHGSDYRTDKFSGYQYGGRPLGLTYVKYLNDGGDAMEGTEGPANLTQDQIM